MFEKIKNRLKESGFAHGLWAYFHQIKEGYAKYCYLKEKYGQDVMILSCALHGTGDIFFVGQYLKAYLEREKITNYVFLLGGKAEVSAAMLFPDLFDENHVEIISEIDIYNLMRFRLFTGCSRIDIRHFHHCSYTPQLTTTIGLEGHRGLSMAELYLYTTLKLDHDTPRLEPVFSKNKDNITAFFKRNKLKPGKTVVLAPYSVSAGQLDIGFWETLTERLRENGFTVCTNSSGPNEPVINGTVSVFFKFVDAASFLEYAGYFVGYRSGLCDIISRVNCKKIIIYPHDVSYCLPGRAMKYVGLKSMRACEDVAEFEYGKKTLKDVLREFSIEEKDRGFQNNKLRPMFSERSVAVASAVSEEYFPYFCVTLQSIIETSNAQNNYDIIVLGDNLSDQSKAGARRLIKNKMNFALRFIEISAFLSQYDLPVEEQYKPIIYARLTLPDLMQNYDRVVYIDADVVLMTDIAELYHTELGNNYLVAVRDTGMLAWYHTPGNPEKDYIENTLKLKHPEQYFNSGVIVFNISVFHQAFSTEFLFEYATSRFWKWRDQDVFMTLCDGRIGHVGQEWNVLVPYFRDELKMLDDGGLTKLKKKYQKALKAPKLIHYIGSGFLSLSPRPALSEHFWKYAQNTPFYDEIMRRALALTARNNITHVYVENQNYVSDYKEAVLQQFKQGDIGFRYIIKYAKEWWQYKVSKLKK